MDRTFLTAALYLIFTLTFIGKVMAQGNSTTLNSTTIRDEQPADLVELIDAYKNLQAPPYDIVDSKDKETFKAFLKENEDLRNALKSYILKKIEDENFKRENAIRVVSQTNTSGRITFWIAHILLAFGILTAALELWNARKLRYKGKRESIEFEISLEKLAMRSSVNGMLMLVISLVFYFMYLEFVYPIIAI